MKKNIWGKRIPTILGIILVLIGITITSFFVKKGTRFITNAGPTNLPKNVKITNITADSFNISFNTEAKVIGTINFGETQKFGQVKKDDRDGSELIEKQSHTMTIKGLLPEHVYFFEIVTGGETFPERFQIKTGPVINKTMSENDPITGKVLLSDGTPPEDGMVYVLIEGAQQISSPVKKDGSFLINLDGVRTDDLEDYLQISESKNIKLLISGEGEKSTISVPLVNTNPVPTVILSKNYDFTDYIKDPFSSPSADMDEPTFASIRTGENNVTSSLEITFPEDGQSFTDATPVFRGKGAPDSSLKLKINAENFTEKEIAVDGFGDWRYEVLNDLPAGSYSVSVTGQSVGGRTITVNKNFIIFASGEQVMDSATPSATPAPTEIPSPTTAPTVSPAPSEIPVTSTPVPTEPISPIPTSTIAPSPVSTIIPSVYPTLSEPPGGRSAIDLTVIGATISTIGGAFFLLVQKKTSV